MNFIEILIKQNSVQLTKLVEFVMIEGTKHIIQKA